MTHPHKLRQEIDRHVGSYAVPLDAPARAHRFLDRIAEEPSIPFPDDVILGDSEQGGPDGIGFEWDAPPLIAIPFAGEDEEVYLTDNRGLERELPWGEAMGVMGEVLRQPSTLDRERNGQ